ncbi:hypothetical protein XENOCAPTIV_015042, partial [Xenoophorus captivus]
VLQSDVSPYFLNAGMDSQSRLYPSRSHCFNNGCGSERERSRHFTLCPSFGETGAFSRGRQDSEALCQKTKDILPELIPLSLKNLESHQWKIGFYQKHQTQTPFWSSQETMKP